MHSERSWHLNIDTGGTFTDCIGQSPEGEIKRVKVLSNSALRGAITRKIDDYRYQIKQEWQAPDGFVNGFRLMLLGTDHPPANVTGFDATHSEITLDRSIKADLANNLPFEVRTEEEAPVLAARLITGTPSGHSLPPLTLRLATTKATNALLEHKGVDTALFVTRGFGDLLTIGTQQRPDLFSLNVDRPAPLNSATVEVPERLDAEGNILEVLNPEKLESRVDELLSKGIRSAAICLMHSYRNDAHEQQLKQWLTEKGMEHISTSSNLVNFINYLPRAETTVVNAYLAPIIEAYLASVRSALPQSSMYVMTSAGGLTGDTAFNPKDSLLSGPAGGVVGASAAGRKRGIGKIISFDMGGTSTDVARCDHDFDYVYEYRVGDAHLVAPAINIETVAAGGGSQCYFDGYQLCVGPESAGAFPGPACYGAGGPLTITDINLLLGRVSPRNFTIPVSVDAARSRLDELVDEVARASSEEVTQSSVMEGFLQIANERMADAIRKISVRKGYDPREYGLVAFGGAGAQHACAIARRLEIDKVLIPRDAGLLSAYGLGHAVLEEFAEEQVLAGLHSIRTRLDEIIIRLEGRARQNLHRMNVEDADVIIRRRLISMRLEGQESTLEVPYAPDADLEQEFRNVYTRRYGHWVTGREIEVESVRVVASTKAPVSVDESLPQSSSPPEPIEHRSVWFDELQMDTPVYDRSGLSSAHRLPGPSIVLDPYSTIVIEPGWEAEVTADGTLELTLQSGIEMTDFTEYPEAAALQLFTNRFSSMAQEMGEMLQRTALSVNVKDRQDFSCALLNPEGELVVNAPHIPVHLGALGLCVRKTTELLELKPGDVIVTNHPALGGSHLPDITVITPVFYHDTLIGFAASRAHHAEIGGSRPGSMPPDATRLTQEGVVIPPMYLVREGLEQWDEIKAHLLEAEFPTRAIEENMADLRAAVAANHRGSEALIQLVGKYGADTVSGYMNRLKEHAAGRMRNKLTALPDGVYESRELLDDGTPLQAKFTVDGNCAAIDFTGSGPVHPGNLNATPAIVNSVVMYVLRLLVDEPLPLNEGLLDPVEIIFPSDTLLNPDFGDDPARAPAVVGGNVEVSQRLVDTLLKPFGLVACSQGTMNNVLFGNDRFGYYETVGGGTGATSETDGADAVHHHMTNTRGTDPEILEHNYPVRLDRYEIRRDSGGKGKFRGGNGITREMTFLEPVRLSVLTQHRVEKPYGLNGGTPGATGEQWVICKDGKQEQLRPTDGRDLQKGDRFVLYTPGGGGFGEVT